MTEGLNIESAWFVSRFLKEDVLHVLKLCVSAALLRRLSGSSCVFKAWHNALLPTLWGWISKLYQCLWLNIPLVWDKSGLEEWKKLTNHCTSCMETRHLQWLTAHECLTDSHLRQSNGQKKHGNDRDKNFRTVKNYPPYHILPPPSCYFFL